ncbi:MAG: formylglycine-generating enzyme family protein [Anaerolineae bacterium]|nr:formylglycine-generating enzyme family protein [Anaerolineae bacterium]
MLRRHKHGQPAFDPLQPAMIAVPAGPFVIGTNPGEVRQLCRRAQGSRQEWYRREQPAHTLTLPEFHIGRYPVTVAEFAAFLAADGYEDPQWWQESGWAWRVSNRVTQPIYWDEARWSGLPEYPVVGVSWYTAEAYCAWLRAQTGLPYRLPSEAEWEKAARGSDGRRYPWGAQWDVALCNTAPQSTDSWDSWDSWDAPAPAVEATLAPVGQHSPRGDSPYGCVDMAGNVWEWCASPLRRYPLDPADTPASVDSDARIVRGGSWYDGPDDARCAARYCYHPHGRDNVVGFRLALSV